MIFWIIGKAWSTGKGYTNNFQDVLGMNGFYVNRKWAEDYTCVFFRKNIWLLQQHLPWLAEFNMYNANGIDSEGKQLNDVVNGRRRKALNINCYETKYTIQIVGYTIGMSKMMQVENFLLSK